MASEPDPLLQRLARDVGARVDAPKASRHKHDLISAVLDTVGALVVLLDREGHIVHFNRACEATTGYSFEEVRGTTLWDHLLVPEEIAPVLSVFEQLRAGQLPNEHENYWLTRAGNRRLIAWRNTALLDAAGAVEHPACLAGDRPVCRSGPQLCLPVLGRWDDTGQHARVVRGGDRIVRRLPQGPSPGSLSVVPRPT